MSEEVNRPQRRSRPRPVDDPQILAAVAQALQQMRYGQVTVVVQDGRVVQVERTDRLRLSQPPLD